MATLIQKLTIALTLAPALTLVVNPSVMAELKGNFESFTIDGAKKTASVGGSTGGSTSIPSIAGATDRNGNKCLGFGDATPDHIMMLKQDVSKLKLQVNSSGRDTTIVIQGPGTELRCGDDSGNKKDASFSGSNWSSGTYKIWVGSMESGTRGNYRLNVQAE